MVSLQSSHVSYIRTYNVQVYMHTYVKSPVHSVIYNKLCLYNCNSGHGSDGVKSVDDCTLLMKRI